MKRRRTGFHGARTVDNAVVCAGKCVLSFARVFLRKLVWCGTAIDIYSTQETFSKLTTLLHGVAPGMNLLYTEKIHNPFTTKKSSREFLQRKVSLQRIFSGRGLVLGFPYVLGWEGF